MAKSWQEPLDPSRHVDHFHDGGFRPRTERGDGFAYFVEVAGFTFEFASLDQVRECMSFFAMRIHPSSRKRVFEPEKGEWQAWHERFPRHVLRGSRRERVIAALRNALASFTPR